MSQRSKKLPVLIYIYMYIYICIYLFVLCSKNDKNIYQNNVSKYTSSNEIRDIKIQFCKTLSKTIY